MKEREHIDINKYSFDEFTSFVFDHEIPVRKGKRHPWYYDVEVTFDAGRVCKFYTRPFRCPDYLREKYSNPQLEEGFWAIQGPAFDCSAFWIMWNADLPFASRRECIESMSDLFKRFFQQNHWAPLFKCGGIRCVTSGIAETERGSTGARTHQCRTSSSTFYASFSEVTRRSARVLRFMDWAICIIPQRKH